jgi:hypothetical protein
VRLMPLRSMYHERLSREHGCSYQNEPAQWQKTSNQTGSGRHEDVLRNKNEPYDISSMGFPLQRNLGEEPGLGLLGGGESSLAWATLNALPRSVNLTFAPCPLRSGNFRRGHHYYHSA